MQVKCTINNLTLRAVVDTGANLTVLSQEMMDKLRVRNEKVETMIMHAAGQAQSFTGKRVGPVKITVGGITLYEKIIIAPIRDTMLLGMDILRKLNAKIDISKNTIECNKQTFPLIPKIRRLTEVWEEKPAILEEDINLRGSAETVVNMPLEGWDQEATILLEPEQDEESPVIIARAIYSRTKRPAICFINTGLQHQC